MCLKWQRIDFKKVKKSLQQITTKKQASFLAFLYTP